MHGQSGEEYAAPVRLPPAVYRAARPAMHSIQFAPRYGVRMMSGPVAQVITGSLHFSNIKIYYQNNEVTKVPSGGQFYIKAGYDAYYPGIHPPDSWSVCITCMATDGSVKNYDITLPFTGSPDDVMKLDAMGLMTMPAHDITLRFYLWASTNVETQPPNQSLW